MTRKTPNADLEGKRSIFFQVGLAIALLIAFLVVNYKQPKNYVEPVTVKVTGLQVNTAAAMDSASVARPPEISRQK
ncbi:MAG: hypothetical protein IKP73_08980 [Bacteroidales bacterium]|nr:hypothetical protein [Bacteroidales bacterium]